MRTAAAVIVLVLSWLLLAAGCGPLEQSEAPPEENAQQKGEATSENGQATTDAETKSAAVVQAFRDAGLEVGEAYPVEQEPGWAQSPVPRTYEEATRFTIPSLGRAPDGADLGGRVFVFESEEDLGAVRDYYEGLDSPIRPYLYTENDVLLQIFNGLAQTEAERYAAVLREAV